MSLKSSLEVIEQMGKSPKGYGKKTHKFSPNEQLELCRRIAWFWTNPDIVEFAQKEYGKKVTKEAIAELRKAEKWTPVIEQFRDEYISKCGEIPLFHKRKRLEELQEQYSILKSDGKLSQARLVLRDIREEAEGKSGDVSFNFTSVTHNEFHQMTDEDLQKEKIKTLEQLEKVRKMKLLTDKRGTNGLGIEGSQEIEEV